MVFFMIFFQFLKKLILKQEKSTDDQKNQGKKRRTVDGHCGMVTGITFACFRWLFSILTFSKIPFINAVRVPTVWIQMRLDSIWVQTVKVIRRSIESLSMPELLMKVVGMRLISLPKCLY